MKGKAKDLRKNHGYSEADAAVLAQKIHGHYTRCAICGVPGRWLKAKKRQGWTAMHIRCRLTVDHIQPGGPSTLANTRILCYKCNVLRGPATRTDEEVLRRTAHWYHENYFTAKELWFLNTSPGRGGKARLGTKRIHPEVNRGKVRARD